MTGALKLDSLTEMLRTHLLLSLLVGRERALCRVEYVLSRIVRYLAGERTQKAPSEGERA
jgi:hypothetical protein